MKKTILGIMLIGLFLAGCPHPIVEQKPPPVERENPFTGAWRNLTTGYIPTDARFVFYDDGAFTYSDYSFPLTGSGKYTFTDTHIIFRDFTFMANGKLGTYPNARQEYAWIRENQFFLFKEDSTKEPYGYGSYIKQ